MTATMAITLCGTNSVWNGTPSRFSTRLRPAKIIRAARTSDSTMWSSASFDSNP